MPTTITSPVPPSAFAALVPNPDTQTLEQELVGGIFQFRTLVGQFYSWLMTTCVDGSGNPYACPNTDFASFICAAYGSTSTTSSTTTPSASPTSDIVVAAYQAGAPNPSNITFTGPSVLGQVTLTMNVFVSAPGASIGTGDLPMTFTLIAPDGTTASGLKFQGPFVSGGGSSVYADGAFTLDVGNSGAGLTPFIGKNANGIWGLELFNGSPYVGNIQNWTLSFS